MVRSGLQHRPSGKKFTLRHVGSGDESAMVAAVDRAVRTPSFGRWADGKKTYPAGADLTRVSLGAQNTVRLAPPPRSARCDARVLLVGAGLKPMPLSKT